MNYKNRLVITAQNEIELTNLLNEIGKNNRIIDFNCIKPIEKIDDLEVMQIEWGCSSNAMAIDYVKDDYTIVIYFTTFDGGCENVIWNLSQKIKGTTIELDYRFASDSIAERCGKIEAFGSEYIFTYYPECTDNALECWCDCWREDIDMFVYDDEDKCYILNDNFGNDEDEDFDIN